jgi:hypothetical protein
MNELGKNDEYFSLMKPLLLLQEQLIFDASNMFKPALKRERSNALEQQH